MNLSTKIKVSIAGALLALASFVIGGDMAPTLGGAVTEGQEYFATTTNTQSLFANYRVIQSPSGKARQGVSATTVATGTGTVLGGITITTPGTSPFCLYDATSTVANAEWATSTIACFPASAAIGNYLEPVSYQKGILIEWTGSPTATTRASTTIYYR